MYRVLGFFVLIVLTTYAGGVDLDDLIIRSEQTKKESKNLGGLIIEQQEQESLTPPEILFPDTDPKLEPLETVTNNNINGCISYKTYYEDIRRIDEELRSIRSNNDKIKVVIENLQEQSENYIDKFGLITKMIEILFGGGGIASLISAYTLLRRKKQG